MTDPLHNLERIGYLIAESSLNTKTVLDGTEAVKIRESSIDPEKLYHELLEHAGSQSIQGWIEGKFNGQFTLKMRINTEAAGTSPTFKVPMKAAFGLETHPSSDTLYALDGASAAVPTFQYAEGFGTDAVYYLNGVVVNEVISETTGEGWEITFNCQFADWGYAFASAVVGTHAQTDTSITVTTGTGERYRPGARITFTGETNGTDGYLITDVDGDELTISPGIQGAGGLSGGESVIPYVPTASLSSTATALGEIACTFSLGGDSLEFNTAKLTFETGHTLLNAAATSEIATRATRGRRRFRAEIEAYGLLENVVHTHGHAHNGDELAFSIVAGNAAVSGQRMTWAMPKVRVAVAGPQTGEDGVVTRQIGCFAKFSSSQNDECTVTLD